MFVRFVKESSLKKQELLADIAGRRIAHRALPPRPSAQGEKLRQLDHMDITVRQETLTNVPGQPVLVQLPIIPCYALTVLVDG